jgi:hypothetical protein
MRAAAVPAHLKPGPIDLAARPRQKLHYAYQQSAILSYVPYRISALPEETQLVADLQELVRLYAEIVSDPLAVTGDRSVEAVIEPANYRAADCMAHEENTTLEYQRAKHDVYGKACGVNEKWAYGHCAPKR